MKPLKQLTTNSKSLLVLYGRFVLVAIPNTVVGLCIFPILKTVFLDGNNLLLMSISHVIAVTFSFMSHSTITFKSKITSKRWSLFFLLNLTTLSLCYIFSTMLTNFYDIDIRIIQPMVSIILQFLLIPTYRKLMPPSIS